MQIFPPNPLRSADETPITALYRGVVSPRKHLSSSHVTVYHRKALVVFWWMMGLKNCPHLFSDRFDRTRQWGKTKWTRNGPLYLHLRAISLQLYVSCSSWNVTILSSQSKLVRDEKTIDQARGWSSKGKIWPNERKRKSSWWPESFPLIFHCLSLTFMYCFFYFLFPFYGLCFKYYQIPL